MLKFLVMLACAMCWSAPAMAQEDDPALESAVAQLEHIVGEWDVVTTFYRSEGHPSIPFEGTYTFDWVHEGASVSGTSSIPQLGGASGILFYVRPGTSEIEMVSVGPDGQLWVMTGEAGDEVRETPVVAMPDGSTIKLRFTRFNVAPDSFESRMDRSTDGGETWVQGNHQVFVRRFGDPADEPISSAITLGDDEQVLRQSLVFNAPLGDVWNRFTTDDGVTSWMAPVGAVDLRSGGTIRTNYNPCAVVGDDGTITLQIVNYVPERFLILRTDLSAQEGAAWINDAILQRAPNMANLIEFEAIDASRTRVTSYGLGYGMGDDWAQMIGFFTAGNEWSFGQLERALAGEAVYPACEQ